LAARCFRRDKHISGLERGTRTPSLTLLLSLADALGTSVGDLTDGLAAPTRQAGRAQALAHITSQPAISIRALAETMRLPNWYVTQLVRHLKSTKAISGPPWSAVSKQPPTDLLTEREVEILKHLNQPTPYAMIALALEISVETVRKHSANIRQKLKVQSRRDLIGILPNESTTAPG